ncbi:MerR family transcriptional regulator [Eubacteriales bacterium OttesenSCG-928-A19]|nr:MerR family transcriptional regulator [Eubacteriales bacterium OttesenSCG-928-A19]
MLSIGAFSKLGHISVRMLRHYDAIGLLAPAHVDGQTGYRYYDWRQLETLGTITLLKSYQFPLARIVELLSLNPSELDVVLHEKRIALFDEIAQLQNITRRLDEQIGQMEDQEMANQEYRITVMELEPQRIFGITRHIHIGQVHDLFQEVKAEMEKRGLKQAGAGMFFYRGEEFNYEDMDVEAAFPVDRDHPDAHMQPGGPHVATMHLGGYEHVHCAYEALGRWIGEHPEYEIAGPGFERYIKDEADGVPPEQFETGVLFPLKKV